MKEHTCKYCKHKWMHEHGGFCPNCHRFQVPVNEIRASEIEIQKPSNEKEESK